MFDVKLGTPQTKTISVSVTPAPETQQSTKDLTQVKNYIYDTKAILGKGSMSIVYKGVDIYTGQFVGVKKISKRTLNSEYLIYSLLNEISIHTTIRHSNIVGLKDVIRSANNIYLVLEYCNEGTLRDYLKKMGKITEYEAKKILSQIIEGMDGLIQKDIIHRDIKPENILCHREGSSLTFKICDFGFSKKLSEKNQLLQSSIGSPQYMDFQRLSSEEYSSKSDVFSLGIIAHEMVFGCPPWSANNWHEIKCQMIAKPFKIEEGSVSKDMENFLKRTLAISEVDRASWEEVKNHALVKK